MSGLSLVLSAAQLALVAKTVIRPKRSFGGIIAHAIIKEQHTDAVQLTEHPIEKGANISDHAIKMPAEIIVTMGWSNTPAGAVLTSGASTEYSIQEIYEALLKTQAKFKLVDVLTSKRAYKEMVIVNLATMTDAENENSMVIVATCRQPIFAQTEVVTLAPGQGAKQASPQATGSTQSSGFKQLQPAPTFNPQAGP